MDVMINRIIRKMALRVIYPNKYSSEKFINYLKKNGASIGEKTYFFDPKNTTFDDKRISYVSIGSYCKITSGVQFLCHDYSWSVLRKKYNDVLPDAGKRIQVGNNVFIGWNTLIIGPVKIGSNVIIGANSVVTHDIPDNTVYAGNPAKLICSLDDYYEKRKTNRIDDALKRAFHIMDVTGKLPTIEDMGWFGFLYLERNKKNEQFLRTLSFKGDSIDDIICLFYSSSPVFDGFDSFLKLVKEKRTKEKNV